MISLGFCLFSRARSRLATIKALKRVGFFSINFSPAGVPAGLSRCSRMTPTEFRLERAVGHSKGPIALYDDNHLN
jgi:hypothetical protein